MTGTHHVHTNMADHEHSQHAEHETFSTDATGLPMVAPTQLVDLRDGDVFTLRVSSVAKQIGDATLRMLAYNGSIPGPTLHVQQRSEITVHVVNDGDVEATVHWHGLRLHGQQSPGNTSNTSNNSFTQPLLQRLFLP